MSRRRRTLFLAAASALLGAPALAASRRALRQMTDGPFYPPPRWRAQWSDWDADLTRVTQGSESFVARGEHLGLSLVVADANGRLVDGAEVEIWQCDVLQHYRHPDVPRETSGAGGAGGAGGAPGRNFDPGFQGFGAGKSDARGELSFRTIKPVAYPGRTPHIHVKARHASFGEWTSQLFVAGDAGNARDFLWRSLPADDRAALEMRLAKAPAAASGAAPLAWTVRQELIVPA
jgi:protocatechuate 3,4-dioxygenase beta subunit